MNETVLKGQALDKPKYLSTPLNLVISFKRSKTKTKWKNIVHLTCSIPNIFYLARQKCENNFRKHFICKCYTIAIVILIIRKTENSIANRKSSSYKLLCTVLFNPIEFDKIIWIYMQYYAQLNWLIPYFPYSIEFCCCENFRMYICKFKSILFELVLVWRLYRYTIHTWNFSNETRK